MIQKPQDALEREARQRAEQRMARILGIIFGGMIVLMIGGMLVFDVYSENAIGNAHNAPADAADR